MGPLERLQQPFLKDSMNLEKVPRPTDIPFQRSPFLARLCVI